MILNRKRPNRPSSLQHHRRHVVATVCIALALSATACGLDNASAVDPTTVPSSTYVASTTPSPVAGGLCLDATESSPTQFAASVQSALASTLDGWVGRQKDSPSQGAALSGDPGLTLDVREVESDSYTTTQPQLNISVPSIPTLATEPSPRDSTFAVDEAAWSDARTRRLASIRRARAESASAAASVAGMPLVTNPAESDIQGCIQALAAQLPHGAHIALASDLEQSTTVNTGQSLTGDSVLVIQSCPDNEAACTARASAWTGWLRESGAPSVTVVRPEVAASALADFLAGSNKGGTSATS